MERIWPKVMMYDFGENGVNEETFFVRMRLETKEIHLMIACCLLKKNIGKSG
jgi:hypothetical protein